MCLHSTGKRPTVKMGKTVNSDPSTPGHIHPSLLLALVVLLGFLIWVNSTEAGTESTVPVKTFLQETIYVTALALDAEMEETGAYPPDLESIGMDEEGLSYSLSSGSYTLVASEAGITVQFQSGDDMEPYRSAFESLLPPYEEGS